ncbi:hypothetical protein GCM10027088_13450 [Nocardia goodfellowii]
MGRVDVVSGVAATARINVMSRVDATARVNVMSGMDAMSHVGGKCRVDVMPGIGLGPLVHDPQFDPEAVEDGVGVAALQGLSALAGGGGVQEWIAEDQSGDAQEARDDSGGTYFSGGLHAAGPAGARRHPGVHRLRGRGVENHCCSPSVERGRSRL